MKDSNIGKSIPKVLVIGQAFHKNSGGGVTISNLFNGWDKEKLFSIISDTENPSYDTCSNYYFLNYKERTLKLLRPFVRKKIPQKNTDSQTLQVSPRRIKSTIRTLILRMITYLGINHLLHNISVSKGLKKWLIEIGDIDILYAQYADYASMKFTYELIRYLNKPLVVHFMDDWIESGAITNVKTAYYESYISRKIWNLFYQRLFNKILLKSDLRICISEAMAVEYKKRYKMDFEWVHNYVNLDQWREGKYEESQSGKFIISYLGTVDIKNLECFQDLFEAIKSINNKSVIVDIYTNDIPLLIKMCYGNHFVRLNNYVGFDDYKKVLKNSSLLFLPLGFSKRSLRFTRYSIPTKLPEFLISGTPVLVYAPEDTTLVKFCKQTHAAVVVSNQLLLASELRTLISDPNFCEEYASRGSDTAQYFFSKEKMQDKFLEMLRKLN